jgi:hypothetical protein
MSEEEEEPPIGVEKEEEMPSTAPSSRLSQGREEERCSSGWSFPPPACVREEERCNGSWSFPPRGTREDEWCGLREKKIYHSSLRLASS